jgi:D-3-phosphoglycerate dehydrogenase
MARPRVLCMMDVAPHPAVLDGLRRVADVAVAPPGKAELEARIGACDGYLATLEVRLTADLLDRAPRLKIVATPSTGLDHLDVPELEKRGIRLISIKTEYELLDRVTSTAEMAWGLLLAAVRKIPAGHAAAVKGFWGREAFRGRQLSGLTLGILGVGRLGAMVADYGRAFRMRVLGCDTAPRRIVPGVDYVDFDTLLRESDVLTIHVHLTPENVKLIGRDAFAKMKPGLILVNTSRGGIIDEAAFLAALDSGRVGAAGLDVVDGEWREDLAEHPLIRYARVHDNLVISPHVGGVTREAQALVMAFVADRMADMFGPKTI